ncbi:MAG: rhomboid family intramembrane serine protease [Gallintestinimicrobium sp.]
MAYRETMENNGMEAGRAKNQIPYCTVVLVALNVILFLIGLILPKAGEWMESEGCFSVVYLLYEHSGFYRLITAAFLHADVEHLLNNMLLLYCCGDVVERCLGKVRFLILYFGSAIFGNLLSAAYELSTGSFMNRSEPAGGFRADGCVAFLVIVKRSGCGISLKRAVFAVVLSLYAGFGSAYVNNAAHVGGLLSGFLLGFY